MKLDCAIIDDEPLAAELLASYARRIPELNLVGVYESAVTAMGELRIKPVDILFLDIQMPELNGLELARLLPSKTKVIFTTAFDRYAVDGYKVKAAGYLLKPISYDDFVMAVNSVADSLRTITRQESMMKNRFVYVKSEYKLVRVDFDDILYVEGVKDYVKFYFSGNRKPMMTLMNMKTVEDSLPHYQFMRVHRSFIVNMDKINMLDRGRIVIGDVFIPVSESYKELVQKYVDRYSLQ
jgi:two-component system LytT family response regulator